MKKAKTQTAASAKAKGQKYFEDGAVNILDKETRDGLQILKGKVLCNFGFIHYPKAAVADRGGIVLASSACDCYESNAEANVCSHVYGLLNAAGYTGTIAVRKDPAVYLNDEDEEKGGADFKLEITEDTTDENGLRKVSGKAVCNFNFIHRPVITIEGGVVKDYTCDCYMAADSEEPCPHCKALTAKALGLKTVKKTRPVKPSASAMPSAGQAEDLPSFESMDFSEEGGQTIPSGDDKRKITDALNDLADDLAAINTDDAAGSIASQMTKAAVAFMDGILGDDAKTMTEEGFEEEEPEEEEPEEPVDEYYNPDREPGTMTLVFGATDEGEPVLWQPNDTSRLFHTNTGIIGTMGTGKTQFTKSMITQLYREQGNNFSGQSLGILIFDYKGDYNESKADFVEATNAKVHKLYRLPFNPFSLKGFMKKPQLPLHAASTFTDIIQKIYKLGPKQSAILTHCIAAAYRQRGIIAGDPATWDKTPPTFEDVYEIYSEDDTIAKNDVLFAAMDKLHSFEIFEGDPAKTESLYEMLKGVVVIDLSGYDSAIQNLVVAFMLELFYSQMQNAGSSLMSGKYRQLRKFILVDEADNFMSQGFPAIKKILKEGREFGVGVILSTQFLKHFVSKEEDYSKYILTWVVHNVADLKRRDVEFVFNTESSGDETEKLFHDIKELESHTSIVKIGNEDVVKMNDLPFFRLIEEG